MTMMTDVDESVILTCGGIETSVEVTHLLNINWPEVLTADHLHWLEIQPKGRCHWPDYYAYPNV